MSEIQVVMKIELLPNEIFLECFKYFDAVNLFYSFDQLNDRFSSLIRTMKLSLHCQHDCKSSFDQFLKKMLLTPEVKTQIRSINLSNKNTCTPVEVFLSLFSLDQFSHLRSLTLTGVRECNIEKLKSILPLLSHLVCFRLVDSVSKADELLFLIPLSKLRILALHTLDPILASLLALQSLENLTVSSSSLNELYDLLPRTPMLQVLSIQNICKSNNWKDEDNCFFNEYLQQLTINDFNDEFDQLIRFLIQTPNLRSLTVSTEENREIIDAYRWEDLITSSLHRLTSLNFRFTSLYNHNIRDKSGQFQSDFWQKKHRWYIEYDPYEHLVHIYTIPYIFSTYLLKPYTVRYDNESMNNVKPFENVSDLTLYLDVITWKSSHYFPNVTSLTLDAVLHFEYIGDPFLKIEHIQFLKKSVNLFHLKHLTISSFCQIDSLSVFLQLLKETPQLSSIVFELYYLQSFFDDDELCQYLNRMITKLHAVNHLSNSFGNVNQLEQFCKVFSNLEQLICYFNHDIDLLFLLNHLPKLSKMKIHLSTSVNQVDFLHCLENEARKLKLTIQIEFENDSSRTVYIWIDQ